MHRTRIAQVGQLPASGTFPGKFLAGESAPGRELVAQAEDKDIDGATLAYVQLTINCVNCHKFSRDNRITSLFPEERRLRAH